MRPSKLRLPLSTAATNQAILPHRLGNRLGQRAAVADAGGAAEAYQVEIELFEVGGQASLTIVVRHHLGPGRQAGLTHGFTLSPRSTAFLATRPAASMTEGLEVLCNW